MTLTATAWLGLQFNLATAADLHAGRFRRGRPTGIEFENGTGDDQVNAVFDDQRTLAASGNEDLDLYGGLTDPAGNTLNFATIKGIHVRAATANGANIVIGGAASNQFSPFLGGTSQTIVLPAGAGVILVHPKAGWSVTDSSADLLRIANSDSGDPATYDISILGTV